MAANNGQDAFRKLAMQALEMAGSLEEDGAGASGGTVMPAGGLSSDVEDVSDDQEQVQEDDDVGGEDAGSKPFSMKEWFANKYNVKFEDGVTDEDLAPRIGGVFEENQLLKQKLAEQERLREEQLGEFLKAYPEFQEFRKSKQGGQGKEQEPARQEQQPTKPAWQPLEYDPEWEVAAEFDAEAGRYVPKTKYGTFGIEAAERLNHFRREQAARARRLTADPWSLVREAGAEADLAKLRDELRQEFQAEQKKLKDELAMSIRAAREAEAVGGEIEQWARDHEKELFVTADNGSPVVVDGQMQLTPAGEFYRMAFNEGQQEFGLSDPQAAHKYAVRQYTLAMRSIESAKSAAQEKSEKARSAKEKNAEQKKKFLESSKPGSKRMTNRDGSVETARKNGTVQNKFLSFREAVLTDPDNAEILGEHFKG